MRLIELRRWSIGRIILSIVALVVAVFAAALYQVLTGEEEEWSA